MAASVACAFFFDAEPLGEQGDHALDACALCSKPLARNSDIFMYKGDTPFCSEDCRDEQMHFGAAYERQAERKQQQLPPARRSGLGFLRAKEGGRVRGELLVLVTKSDKDSSK